MKLITKWNDYYDYLIHIYGVDDKMVLDRRQYDIIKFTPNEEQKIVLYLCDYIFEGFYRNGHVYWGKDVLQIADEKEKLNFDPNKDIRIYIRNNYLKCGEFINIYPYKTNENLNTLEKCPIMIKSFDYNRKYDKYPILQDLNFNSVLEPQQIYLLLTEWLSPKENHIDTRTDKDKIVSNGFDLKTSFRKM